ncbi:site-specific integrase [Rhodoferax sp. AJA081-3]|uniref:tyrosine-type recombinase/integrase n=1 Tax=Rhodoferax sp. AJA081-3 TaxID=2752316 RepID=UPI001AE03E08|nr:tyrosine-type recombinase/integrase [Rhodoferax sp. AJA081-3]QTN29981.1 site-specific integrase [Rhodoferax sp. AJA081-3]
MANGLVCPPGKVKIEYSVADEPGLFVECRASSTAVPMWYLRLKNSSGTNVYRKLGAVRELSLAQARKLAKQTRTEHLAARSQAPKADAPKSEITLQKFMTDFYMPHALTHKRTAGKDLGMFNHRIASRFGHVAMHAISRLDVQLFHSELVQKVGVSKATADHHLKLMRRMLNLAVQWEFLEKNQLARIACFNQDTQLENYLDADSVQRLVTVCKSHPKRVIGLLLMFLLSTGARKASAMHAKWEDIDIANRVWRIPASDSKSKKVATVFLNESAIWVLNQLQVEGVKGYVFVHERTKKPYSGIEKTWYAIRKLASISEKVRVHDLRHTYASMLVTSGRSLYEVQKLLSHSDPKVTMRYAHLSPKTLHEAASAASVLVASNTTPALAP